MRGKFIVFEGGDGTGKSTQIKLLNDYLKEKGFDVLLTREPGGVKSAEEIRNIILNQDIDPVTEALLFASARREHLQKKVIPALNDGKIVLCDRFLYSSLAYQGYARGLGIKEVYEINEPAISDTMPDLTILLELSPEKGIERINKNRANEINRLDLEGIEFHKKVSEGYNEVIKMYPEHKCVKIDASNSIEEVFESIKNAIEKL